MKLYLNGEIKDKYRSRFTGNGAITSLDKSYISSDEVYFDKYESILMRQLGKEVNVLFSMSPSRIYNPFTRYSREFGRMVYNQGYSDWDWTDFFKIDAVELFDDYDYMILLPRWWRCKEAWLKLFVAKSLDIKIITFKKLMKELS